MRYFWLTCKHKWFVLVAGLRIGAPLWRLVIHDWTKFLPCELPHYDRQFFGGAGDPKGFGKAWRHHWKSNDHHHQYWVGENDIPLRMSGGAVREMVADWMGASRAYEGRWPKDGWWPWFERHFDGLPLHDQTRALVMMIVVGNGIFRGSGE